MLRCFAGEHHDELVLGLVGVLELVDEHVLEALLVVLEHVGAGAEEVDGDHEQVVEVHGAGRVEAVLVLAVDVGDAPLVDRAARSRVRLEVDRARSWPR